MLNDPKLMAFGQWLTEQTVQRGHELSAVCGNDKMELPTVKRKYGQLEAFTEILKAFSELYEGDLDKFRTSYLNETKENENE